MLGPALNISAPKLAAATIANFKFILAFLHFERCATGSTSPDTVELPATPYAVGQLIRFALEQSTPLPLAAAATREASTRRKLYK